MVIPVFAITGQHESCLTTISDCLNFNHLDNFYIKQLFI